MKTILIIISIFLFQINSLVIFSQNTMLLTNGKKITIGQYKIGNNNILAYKNKKDKLKNIELEDVFSIVEKSGNEKIFYKSDSTNKEYFTVEQMRYFIKGENDAANNYKSPWTTVGGVIVGVGTVVSVPLVGLNSLYAPLLPIAYNSSVGLIQVKTEKLGIESQYIDNKHYVLGYKKTAKQKRITNSLFGSGIGIVVGIAAVFVIFN